MFSAWSALWLTDNLGRSNWFKVRVRVVQSFLDDGCMARNTHANRIQIQWFWKMHYAILISGISESWSFEMVGLARSWFGIIPKFAEDCLHTRSATTVSSQKKKKGAGGRGINEYANMHRKSRKTFQEKKCDLKSGHFKSSQMKGNPERLHAYILYLILIQTSRTSKFTTLTDTSHMRWWVLDVLLVKLHGTVHVSVSLVALWIISVGRIFWRLETKRSCFSLAVSSPHSLLVWRVMEKAVGNAGSWGILIWRK